MVMIALAVEALVAVALCVLAVALAMLLVPNISWAGVLEWMTTQPPSPCACIFGHD